MELTEAYEREDVPRLRELLSEAHVHNNVFGTVMDKETFQDAAVASYLNEHFISIKLNAESKNTKIKYGGRTYTPASLARAFKVRAYPSVVYLDEKGEFIFVDKGFKKPGQFMVNLKYVKSGCHEKGVSIEEFRRRINAR